MTQKKKPNHYSYSDIHLEDDTPETKYLRNSIDNFSGIMDLLKGPIKILENNAVMGVFSGKGEFEGTPDEASILDMRMLDKIVHKVMMELEGIVKTYARHGKKAILDTDTFIHTIDKRTGKRESAKQLTAVENLVQGAVIGYWLEMVTTIRYEKGHKRELLNGLLNDSTDDDGVVLEDDEDMKRFLGKADMLEAVMAEFNNVDIKELELPKLFPNPKDLAESFYNHNEEGKDFMEEVSKRMDKYLEDVADVDKAIHMSKIEDKVLPLLKKIKDNGKGIVN